MTLGQLWKEREAISNETLISSYIQHLQLEASKNESGGDKGSAKASKQVFMPPAPKRFSGISEMREFFHNNRGFKGKVTPKDG